MKTKRLHEKAIQPHYATEGASCEEASWYKERGLEISEYNTLERVKYYLQEYRKWKG